MKCTCNSSRRSTSARRESEVRKVNSSVAREPCGQEQIHHLSLPSIFRTNVPGNDSHSETNRSRALTRQDKQPARCIEAWAFPSHHLCLLPPPTCTTASWPRGATMPARNAKRPCYPYCHQTRCRALSPAYRAHYCMSFLSDSTNAFADGMLSAAHHRCNGSVVTIQNLLWRR